MRVPHFPVLLIGFLFVSLLIATTAHMRSESRFYSSTANTPPTANDDIYSRHGNGLIGPLLENDFDPEGDPMTVQLVTFPTHGNLSGVNGNSFSYQLTNQTFIGSDSFTYKACDNQSACSNVATVTINIVNQAPVATNDSYTAHGVTTIGPMLINDFDPDGDQITWGLLTAPAHGTLSGLTQPDLKRYQPHFGYAGVDSFTYQVCDQFGLCSTPATVTLNVNNNAPVASPDMFVVRGPTIIGPLFENDYDPDGDAFNGPTVTVGASHGTVFGLEFPTFPVDVKQYVPIAGYAGTDTFEYEICDSFGGCSRTVVTLWVIGDGSNDGKTSCNTSVGRPINVTNGNMYLQQNDYQLPGVGFAIDVTRTYNSNSQRVGLFGRGWSTAYDESATAYDANMMRLSHADGRVSHFGRPAGSTAGYLSLEKDFHGQVTQTGIGFDVTMKDGSLRRFDSAGKPIFLRDRRLNTTTLGYGADGFLDSITDAVGRQLMLTTNGGGRVQSISDSMGVVASYSYDAADRLTSVTYADNSSFQFAYDSNHRLTSVMDALGNIVESHTYDAQGRALTSETHGGIERYTLAYVSETETHVTDALSRLTKYTFDTSKGRNLVTRVEGLCNCGGSQIQTWNYDNQLNVLAHTDALNHNRTYTYDNSGNRLTETDVAGTVTYTYNQFGEVLTRKDQLGKITTNTYDAQGRLLTATNALGKTTSFTYDTRGQMLTTTDARGKLTSFEYNSDGNLVAIKDPLNNITQFGYDPRGRLIAITNAMNQVTLFFHDSVGRLIQLTRPDVTSTVFEYDLAGRRTATIDAKGNRSSLAYDRANRLVGETDALNQTNSFSYDLMSNLISRTDVLGRVTEFEYDDFYRLRKIIYPPASAGSTRQFESLAYDATGKVTERTDAVGRVTRFAYDEADRLSSSTDADGKTTSFEYDAIGRTTAVVDALNQRYRFNYDAVGQLRHLRRGATVMSFAYDASGNRKRRTDYNGALTDYNYDALNRLKTITYPDSTTVSYTYDKLSRLQTATNAHGTVNFDYNRTNRLKSVTDVFGKVIDYAYDPNGNRTRLSVNDGTVATYRYDALNRLTKMFDGAGAVFTFAYDATGKLSSRKAPNGVTATYQYDGLDRLIRLTSKRAQTTLADFQYQFNDGNNISQVTDLSSVNSYSYDLVDRLVSATHANQANESFTYDAVGNRTASHLSAAYAHEAFNRLASSASATFSHDTNGNLTSKTDATGTAQYGWDFENRLSQVTLPDGTGVSYKYDALGRRIERSVNLVSALPEITVERFVYDGADVVRDIDENGLTLNDYVNGPGIDNKLRQTNNVTGSLYFLTDHLGSTTGLTDATGNLVEQLSYDSFGNNAGSTRTRYGYTGRERDPETDLLYYRARFYDPEPGRFISEDPIGFLGGDVNLYGYVRQNPLSFRDPLGLDGWGNDLADWLDNRIDKAERYWRYDDAGVGTKWH